MPGLTAKFGKMVSGSLQASELNEFDDLDFPEMFDEGSSVSKDIHMFWLDACEDAVAQPGNLH